MSRLLNISLGCFDTTCIPVSVVRNHIPFARMSTLSSATSFAKATEAKKAAAGGQHERCLASGCSVFCLLTTVLCLLSSVFCPIPLWALDTLHVSASDPVLEDWRWTVFDKRSGLAGRVSDVYEDRDQSVWFATTNGAQRYDGVRWTTLTARDGLIDDGIAAVIRDRDGAVWFGGKGGISRLVVSDSGDSSWATYQMEEDTWVSALGQASDGGIWAGLSPSRTRSTASVVETMTEREDLRGILRFSGGTWTRVEPTAGSSNPRVYQITRASDGSLWFATHEGMLHFDGVRWRLARIGGISQFIEARDASIWGVAGRRPGEVLRYLPPPNGKQSLDDQRSWTRYSAVDVGFENLSGIWQTDDGSVWVSGIGEISRFHDNRWISYPEFGKDREIGRIAGRKVRGGVWMWGYLYGPVVAFRFRDDTHVTHFSHTDSLRVGTAGPDGAVWFHTSSAAVRLLDGVWTRYTSEDGFLEGRVGYLDSSQDGSIWAVGRHHGMGAAARFVGGQWQVFTERDGVIERPIRMLAARDGSLWVMGTHRNTSAVSRYREGSWQRYGAEYGFSGLRMTIGYEASDGSVWFGSLVGANVGAGLYRFDPRIESGEGAAAGERWTKTSAEEDNWFGTKRMGILTLGLGEWPVGTLWAGTLWGVHRIELSQFPQKETWSIKTDLGFDTTIPPKVRSFVPTEQGMWFTPVSLRNAGVMRFDGDSWSVFRQEDGLPDDAIARIFRASDGAVWFVGRTGLSRFGTEGTGVGWTRFRAANGIERLSQVRNVVETRDGSLWMSADGQRVLRFRYHEPAVPETDIRRAVGRVSSEGNILIRWSGATRWNEVPQEELHYKWRLNPSTSLRTGPGDWTETADTDITFTSLAPGAYQFEVFALSPSMRADTTPAVHAFVVEPPWWRNPLVAGPGFVLVIAVLFQTVRVAQRDKRLRASNAALSDANNELFAVNANLQRANEEIQLQTERKSAFLASMSHELRTPMNAIKGFTNLVMRRSGDALPERQLANLRKVDQASDHLLAQINDLLDLSKIEAGKMDVDVTEFDVREAVEYCVSTVSPLVQEGVELSATVDDSVGLARTDEQRVRQMVINLLSNAVKFTDAGSVRVSVTQAERGRRERERGGKGKSKARVQGAEFREAQKASSEYRVASAEFRGKTQHIVISVSDTGKGIPEEEIPTLFDEYRQVQGQSESDVQRGTGLGLSITKRFAELLGGSIEVESEVGKGSTFTVRIPSKYEHS